MGKKSYYWFEPPDGILGYGDRRKPEIGKTHSVNCKLKLCKLGLHASKRIIDALNYAQSNVVYEVELSGDIIHGDDKSCATHRKYLWKCDISNCLRKFACMCALDVIHLWNAPEIVVKYLKTQDETLRVAAWAAAWAATWVAASDAASNAARAATRAATWVVASDDVSNAASAAARAAARAATWVVASDAASDAARAATWVVASDGLRTKQNNRLLAIVGHERKRQNG